MRTRRSILAQGAALVAGAAGVWWLREEVLWPAPHPAFAPGAGGSGWLPFLDGPELVAVAATVNGQPIGALIDSGAQSSVIDRAAAARLGVETGAPLPMIAYGVTGAPQVGRAATLDVALGALSLPKMRVAMLDIGPLVAATGRRVELVIGQDVLREVVLDLDLPARRLALRPPGPPPAGLRPVSSRLHGRELLARVAVDGYALEAVVDTGSSSPLALSEHVAQAAGLLAPGRRVRLEEGVTFGGAARNRVVVAHSLSLAGQTPLRCAPVQIYPDAGAGALPDGLVGVGVLREFRVWLDLGRGALALAPARSQRGSIRTAAVSQKSLSGWYCGET